MPGVTSRTGGTVRKLNKHRLYSCDNDDNLELLDSLNINRIKKLDLHAKIENKALGEIYKSKAPEIKDNIRESLVSVEELRPEHKFKPSSLDDNTKIIKIGETNENKILNTIEEKGGIFKLSQKDEMIEFIDMHIKLEKAIEYNFDENWFIHKISDNTQSFGKADILLSNKKTGNIVSIQLKLKESTIDEKKLGLEYRETDIIIIGYKNKDILEKQIKIVENMSEKISNKIHLIDLSPYYSDEESYYDKDKIIQIIKQSRLNKDSSLYFEEKYNEHF